MGGALRAGCWTSLWKDAVARGGVCRKMVCGWRVFMEDGRCRISLAAAGAESRGGRAQVSVFPVAVRSVPIVDWMSERLV